MSAEARRTHAFCEADTAGPFSPWHIRLLTDAGLKLGGGADTESLCGRRVSWDRKIAISPRLLREACLNCSRLYAASSGKDL